jgi:hypothetical protein
MPVRPGQGARLSSSALARAQLKSTQLNSAARSCCGKSGGGRTGIDSSPLRALRGSTPVLLGGLNGSGEIQKAREIQDWGCNSDTDSVHRVGRKNPRRIGQRYLTVYPSPYLLVALLLLLLLLPFLVPPLLGQLCLLLVLTAPANS